MQTIHCQSLHFPITALYHSCPHRHSLLTVQLGCSVRLHSTGNLSIHILDNIYLSCILRVISLLICSHSMQLRLAQSSQVSTVLQRLVTLAAGFVMAEWGARWVEPHIVTLLWHCFDIVVTLLWHCCGIVVTFLWHCDKSGAQGGLIDCPLWQYLVAHCKNCCDIVTTVGSQVSFWPDWRCPFFKPAGWSNMLIFWHFDKYKGQTMWVDNFPGVTHLLHVAMWLL